MFSISTFKKNEYGIDVRVCCVTCKNYNDGLSCMLAKKGFVRKNRLNCYCEDWEGNNIFNNAGKIPNKHKAKK